MDVFYTEAPINLIKKILQNNLRFHFYMHITVKLSQLFIFHKTAVNYYFNPHCIIMFNTYNKLAYSNIFTEIYNNLKTGR